MHRERTRTSHSEEFGRRVREARKAMRDGAGRTISQERFAHLTGLHRTYIGHVERGEVNLTLSNVIRIARVLGVDAGDLVRGLQDIPDASVPAKPKKGVASIRRRNPRA